MLTKEKVTEYIKVFWQIANETIDLEFSLSELQVLNTTALQEMTKDLHVVTLAACQDADPENIKFHIKIIEIITAHQIVIAAILMDRQQSNL